MRLLVERTRASVGEIPMTSAPKVAARLSPVLKCLATLPFLAADLRTMILYFLLPRALNLLALVDVLAA